MSWADRPAENAGQLQQIGKFHPHITLNAGDRSPASHIFIGEDIHDRVLETAGMIENIMGNAKPVGHGPGVADILSGAAASHASHSFAMVVKLQGNTDGFRAGARRQRGNDARIHTARHRHDDALACKVIAQLKISVDSVHHLNCRP